MKCVSSLLLRYRNLTSIELRYVLYEVRLRLKSSAGGNFESVLHDVIADDQLPPVAEATAATHALYGPSGLTTVQPPAERDTAQGDKKSGAEPNHSDSAEYPSPSTFKIDYASLEVREPI